MDFTKRLKPGEGMPQARQSITAGMPLQRDGRQSETAGRCHAGLQFEDDLTDVNTLEQQEDYFERQRRDLKAIKELNEYSNLFKDMPAENVKAKFGEIKKPIQINGRFSP